MNTEQARAYASVVTGPEDEVQVEEDPPVLPGQLDLFGDD